MYPAKLSRSNHRQASLLYVFNAQSGSWNMTAKALVWCLSRSCRNESSGAPVCYSYIPTPSTFKEKRSGLSRTVASVVGWSTNKANVRQRARLACFTKKSWNFSPIGQKLPNFSGHFDSWGMSGRIRTLKK